ncbi:hypothetical protein BCR43DRAFT_493034 [Syncephalastrum racemosum]|uniref:Uncharacterized protein n=1 Tax=Syncephalastrum racemosum TaxID=13706 RepID=A0A1X2H9W3_SYNRA|nr:hypothetical protein BCR43DRAFT_493034 [Syncephalastrum racemosum]
MIDLCAESSKTLNILVQTAIKRAIKDSRNLQNIVLKRSKSLSMDKRHELCLTLLFFFGVALHMCWGSEQRKEKLTFHDA